MPGSEYSAFKAPKLSTILDSLIVVFWNLFSLILFWTCLFWFYILSCFFYLHNILETWICTKLMSSTSSPSSILTLAQDQLWSLFVAGPRFIDMIRKNDFYPLRSIAVHLFLDDIHNSSLIHLLSLLSFYLSNFPYFSFFCVCVQIEFKYKYKVRIFMDESYSFGVLGKTGRGITEHANVKVSLATIVGRERSLSLRYVTLK